MGIPIRGEHARYAIAFRLIRMMKAFEERAYTVPEIAEKLEVSKKTAYRMIRGLETMGIPFYYSERRWRILK